MNHKMIVTQLIAANADVNKIDSDGATALSLAKLNNNEAIEKLLIDAGAATPSRCAVS